MANPKYGRQRVQRRAAEDGGPDGPPPPRRRNDALIIGLVVGGLLLILLVFFLASGGGMPDSDIAEARGFLRQFLQVCLENRKEEGVAMMDWIEVLRDENPNDVKAWRELSAERVSQLQEQAYSFLSVKVRSGLQLSDPTQIEKILAACDVRPNDSQRIVAFTWSWRGATWTAQVSKAGADRQWKVYRLDEYTK